MLRINEAEYEATKAKVAKLSDRARKRGFTGSVALEAQRVVVESIDELGLQRTDVWFDVELSGEPPCYQGWTFLAVLDWDEYAGLIIRTAPGVQRNNPIDRESLKENYCDHCRTNRNRSKTYLVRNEETGQLLQVGSTCLKDFLGWDASVVFLDTDSVIADLAFGIGSGRSDCVGTTYALAVAWALVKLDGFKPASSYGRTTKGDVIDVLWPPLSLPPDRRAELARIRDLAHEAMERALQCRTWVLSDDFEGPSEYVTNLKNVAAAEYVSSRNIGLLASAPQAWAKWQHRTLIRESRPESNWVGEVGQRLVITATVQAIKWIEGNYGTTVLYLLRDAAGNVVKWFASREALGDKVGEEFTIKATIKELETFQDVKQTVITRATVQACSKDCSSDQ